MAGAVFLAAESLTTALMAGAVFLATESRDRII